VWHNTTGVSVFHFSAIKIFAGGVRLVHAHHVVNHDWVRKGEPVWLSVSVKGGWLMVRSGYASSSCIIELGWDREGR
jgi:hypothetical protein